MRARGLNQSLEGIKVFASLGAGAVMLWIVYVFGDLLLPEARESAPGGHGGVQMNDWFEAGLDVGLPVMYVGLVFFGLIATAVFSRRYA